MKHHRHYSKEKAVSIVLRIILAALVVFAIYTVSTAVALKSWDVEYPMANARIEWTGAGYNGALEARE